MYFSQSTTGTRNACCTTALDNGGPFTRCNYNNVDSCSCDTCAQIRNEVTVYARGEEACECANCFFNYAPERCINKQVEVTVVTRKPVADYICKRCEGDGYYTTLCGDRESRVTCEDCFAAGAL